jgi:hypothetical protein
MKVKTVASGGSDASMMGSQDKNASKKKKKLDV